MSIHVYHPSAIAARLAIANRAHTVLVSFIEALYEWRERAHQRLLLGRLDDRMLQDIGLSRSDVEHEVAKPFWQG